MAEDRELARARRFARVMDDYLVDPLIGMLVPGLGDVVGSVLGLYIVAIALRRRTSPVVIARMISNLLADALLGIVPIVGDALDFRFRANRRNADLLADRSARAGRARWSDWVFLASVAGVFLTVIGLAAWGVVALVRHL